MLALGAHLRRLPIRQAIALLILLATAAPALAQDCIDWETLPGTPVTLAVPGAARVAVAGDLAYVAAGASGLLVLDLGATDGLSLLATIPTAGAATDVELLGGHLLVAEATGLEAFSLATPTDPVPVGGLVLAGGAGRVVRSGDIAFLCCGTSGLRLVDVSAPAAPTLLGTADTPGEAADVVVIDSHAYVADGSGAIQVVDVHDPLLPTIVAGLGEYYSRVCNTLATKDGHLYAMINSFYDDGPGGFWYQSSLWHIDTGTPEAPTWTPTISLPTYYAAVMDGGGELFLVTSSHATVLDTGNPESPVQGYDGYTAGAGISDLDLVDGRLLLVGEGQARLYDPFSPQPPVAFESALPHEGRIVQGMGAGGDFVWQSLYEGAGGVGGQSWYGIQVWDVQVPTSPTMVLELGGYGSDYLPSPAPVVLAARGRVVATADLTYGPEYSTVRIRDYSRPEAPVSCSLPQPGDRLALADGRAYERSYPASASPHLTIYDITDPASAVQLGHVPLTVPVDRMIAIADQLYILGGGALYRIDAGDPAAPGDPVTVPLSGLADGMVRDGELLYLYRGTTLQIVLVSDPAAPVQVAEHSLWRGQAPMAVRDGYVYACGDGIHVYSAQSITGLDYVGSSWQYSSSDLGYAGARLYSRSGDVRSVLPQCPQTVPVALERLDLEILDDAVRLTWRAPGLDGAASWLVEARRGDEVWTVPWRREDGGFVARDDSPRLAAGGVVTYTILLRGRDGDLVALAEREAALAAAVPAVRALAVSPNPFNPACKVRFGLDRPGRVLVTAHDLAGRRVATVLDRELAAGDHVLTWHALDDRSRPLASGVYLLRLQTIGRTEIRKVAVVR